MWICHIIYIFVIYKWKRAKKNFNDEIIEFRGWWHAPHIMQLQFMGFLHKNFLEVLMMNELILKRAQFPIPHSQAMSKSTTIYAD